MFGYLRFILAITVLLSHTGLSPNWGNIGATAVTIFYMLSGYVITNILVKNIDRKNLFIYFYLDRILRIFPLYITILLIYIIVFYYEDIFFSFKEIISNIILIPCNYTKERIIPVSWSLALEFQAYLLFPFLIKFRWLFYGIGIFSMVIFLMANLSMLEKYYWGYFKIPGVFFIFLTGSLLTNINIGYNKQICILILLLSITGFILIELGFIQRGGFQSEVLLGIVLGITSIHFLKNKKRLFLNTELGAISYGVFLIHMLVIFMLKDYSGNIFVLNFYVISLSIMISATLYYFFERRISNFRINRN